MTMQVLVVDDVPAMAEQYAYDLKRVGGYHTIVAAGGDQALDVLAREPIDCVVLDLEMPGTDGFEVLRRLQQRGIDTPVIVYTGTGSYDRCVQAVRLGAYGFVDKAEPIERVVQEIENAVSRGRLVKELRTLRSRFDGETPLIGDSAPMRSLREAIARVAPIPSSVLIVGESGTGKELVARELHRRGPGAKTPLVAVNSAALPEQLVESELFGHERGAFTGADRLRRGAFENAGTGTLFLDEVGELPLPAQAKLLRVLEERKVMRVGGDRAIQVTARVVAATNRDLEREVEAGRFRQDLYYRLNVHTLRVPAAARAAVRRSGACRSSASDRSPRISACGRRRSRRRRSRCSPPRLAEEQRPRAAELSGADDDCVRCRRHRRSRCSAGDSRRGTGRGRRRDRPPGTLKALKAQAERQIVLGALDKHDWHVTRTAEALGLADHSSLLKIMRRHGLSKGMQRDA